MKNEKTMDNYVYACMCIYSRVAVKWWQIFPLLEIIFPDS